MDRQECKFLISLYAVDDYYVELYLHKKYIQAVKITAFECIAHLEPYLAQIDLTELLTPH
jgi:hypothetical protein